MLISVLKRWISNIDPRADFVRSYNTPMQLMYLGLVSQAVILTMFAFHNLQHGEGFLSFGVAVNMMVAYGILDLGIQLLQGQGSRKWLAVVFCFNQGILYLVNLSRHQYSANLNLIALAVCAVTVYLLLFSRETRQYFTERGY